VRLEQRERLRVEHDAAYVVEQPQRGVVDPLAPLFVE
jgi:hypothetical protein